ncbi:hypothetical protein BEN49_05830 [Hymenobacter coccineus]|uniref:Resolvase/invertase-type recombinase catalytic domain-containing protein n=2 Tax=Hymenobacter coccineus TaxID=1908235 RepID=A0A1G1TJF0_9BACT|nr:hypothetical protein BEN49_05830 [Hymenobacter coccineus]
MYILRCLAQAALLGVVAYCAKRGNSVVQHILARGDNTQDLGIDTTTPAGKFMLSIFASSAEYDRESVLEKTKAGQQLAAAQSKRIGWPKELDAENLIKVKKAHEKSLSVSENVQLTGTSLTSIKRYRKHLFLKQKAEHCFSDSMLQRQFMQRALQ